MALFTYKIGDTSADLKSVTELGLKGCFSIFCNVLRGNGSDRISYVCLMLKVTKVWNVFREHNERCHKLIGKDMAADTVERYETSLKHTLNFIKFNYGKGDLPIEEVNHKFITDYEFYLKTERNCSHNSASKYLKNFKKIIRIALANDYIQKDPFKTIQTYEKRGQYSIPKLSQQLIITFLSF